MEGVVLKEEFIYQPIAQARSDFHRLVLTRMRMETKMLHVDLNEFYLDEAGLYNFVVPADHGGEFIPICASTMVVHPSPQNQLEAEQGEE